ncbi:M2 family metallopeptidase [Marinicella gelatinilytica]|uniref:M2 family metallopeptidase n=1 Tax=Marinicella gelatinilytica TaxID=2996017 RepID=UPI0022609ED9|nr:M2 family metallopeptidase [Marinicella gelatinilytica]MCX7545251.1 M2 family metallopeptidase [Marinicella gelatinilytica]
MKKIFLLFAVMALAACQSQQTRPDENSKNTVTQQDAAEFLQTVEDTYIKESEYAARVAWVQANFITEDTVWLGAKSIEKMGALQVKFANQAKKFDHLDLPADMRRRLEKIKGSLTLAAPDDVEKNAELAQIMAKLEAMYGAGKYCVDGECRDLGELSKVIAESRNHKELLDAWTGWRTISVPMRDKYERMVELANEGARELGFADTGAMWRAGYDMPADDFAVELDRLWGQVEPLYNALQCHVRSELTEQYGEEVMGDDGMIPAHLLGNMWAQDWTAVYDLVKPANAGETIDVTARLKAQNYDAKKMVKTAENFFVSLGLDPLPETFWERSLFLKPQDRDVVCHASAWDIDNEEDIRIKMCIKEDYEDFVTVHHELGHNFYQRAYKDKSILYRNGANDGFHEAIGDTIALSMTPKYFKDIGLIDEVPESDNDLGMLMSKALEKVAFVPFGLMIDQWRWQVFNGEISADEYNAGWWRLRNQYQGVKSPVERDESQFDPGAKYHIPGNTPYTRYFLAHILQFQFHRELCKAAGFEGDLHRCSIYNNKAAGDKLIKVLEMGAEKPWQDAMQVIANSRDMDATAMLDYFAPLKAWLDEQNKDRQCGW